MSNNHHQHHHHDVAGGGKIIRGKEKDERRYSDMARAAGCVDVDLMEIIERDMVNLHGATKVHFEDIAGLDHVKELLQEAVMLPRVAPHLFCVSHLFEYLSVLYHAKLRYT